MTPCLFVAALSHSVPSVYCFVVMCVWLPLCVSSSPSLSPPIPPTVFRTFFWLSHHPMFLPPTSPWLSICSLTSCNSCLFSFLSLSFSFFLYVLVSLTLSLPPPPPMSLAFGRELQSQLFVLELLQAHHDGILVYTGLSSAGYQSHTHQLLLHTPHQLCCSHGPCGGQGRCLLCSACQQGIGRIKGIVVHHLINCCWQKDLKKEGGKGRGWSTTSGKWIITLQTLQYWVIILGNGNVTIDSSSQMMTLGWQKNLHFKYSYWADYQTDSFKLTKKLTYETKAAGPIW